jgi:hypothetical protein
MANPHYIRFENTLKELNTCKEALDDENYKGASLTEQHALTELISLCGKFFSEYGNSTIDFNEYDDNNDLLDEDEFDDDGNDDDGNDDDGND